MRQFEVHFIIKCVVPFEAKDRQAVVNWALRLGADEIIARRDERKDRIEVTGSDEIS